MTLITLIYASSATWQLTEADLFDILSIAHEHNASVNITGMLLYKSGNFLQVLEGDEKDVQELYARIRKDPRHEAVTTLLEQPIAAREFAEWSMGFVNMSSINPKAHPAYSDFLKQSIEAKNFKENPSYAQIFLRNFKELIR